MTSLRRERTGTGPPLILLHATLSSARQLRPLAGLLAATHTVISVDRRPGGGPAGDGVLAPIDVAVHVEDLAAIAAAERLGPAVVVGHSYGGCIALELAARRPALVRAVFAYEPPYGPLAPPPVQARMADAARRTLEAAERDGAAAAALVFMRAVSGAAAVEALGPAGRDRIGRAGAGAVADATLQGMDPDGLTRIACPVRLATGTASEPFYAPIAAAIVERVGGATLERLEGLDHLAPITRPDAVAAAVEAFLVP